MNQEIITLVILVVALITIIWARRKARMASSKSSSPAEPGFNHEYSAAIFEEISNRVFPGRDQAALRSLFETFQFKFSPRRTFIFTPPSGTAAKLAQKTFAEAEVGQVLAQLSKYQSESGPADTELMQVHILKAADGDLSRVGELVVEAKKDFRDVLNLAHSPNCVNAVLTSKGRIDLEGPEFMAASDQDLRQYVDWLIKYT